MSRRADSLLASFVAGDLASFVARAGRKVISLACGRRIRILPFVATSALLGSLLGLLLFALSLRERVLALSRHDGLPAAPTTATATATATALGLGASFVDVERSPIEFLTVQCFDSGACCAVRHGHEGEAAGPPCFPIGDHGHVLDFTVGGERVTKRVFIRVEAQVSYIDLQNISPNL